MLKNCECNFNILTVLELAVLQNCMIIKKAKKPYIFRIKCVICDLFENNNCVEAYSEYLYNHFDTHTLSPHLMSSRSSWKLQI